MKEVCMEVVLLKTKDLEREYVHKSPLSSSSGSFSEDDDTSHAYHSNSQSKEEKINDINRIQLQK